MTKVVLSPSQQRAEDEFLKFLDSSDQEMVIAGAAGTGKSFLTRHLRNAALKYLQVQLALDKKSGFRMVFTATTNKAATVLAGMMGEPATTVHSFLGLQVKNDFRTGQTRLESTNRSIKHRKTLVFLDEASMVNNELLGWIRELIIKPGSKVVYIGDNYQLPPVKSKVSPVFLRVKNQIELKEIQRQVAGSPIIEESVKFRELLDLGPDYLWPEIQEDNNSIFRVSRNDFEKLVDQDFHKGMDPDKGRVVAYTNDRVIGYNNQVRNQYAASTAPEAGEWMATNNPILDGGGNILHGVDSDVHVSAIVSAQSVDGVDGYEIRVQSGHTVFMPVDQNDAKELRKKYSKEKDWANFFRVKNGYADLRPSYAQTVHKSQGSTYDNVYVDLDDIGTNLKWYEVARLVYVALTRAKHKVYFTGELPHRGWTK